MGAWKGGESLNLVNSVNASNRDSSCTYSARCVGWIQRPFQHRHEGARGFRLVADDFVGTGVEELLYLGGKWSAGDDTQGWIKSAEAAGNDRRRVGYWKR